MQTAIFNLLIPMPIIKIAVIGPESTGKSSLCEKLASQFKTQWVPEYARTWLMINGKQYKESDLLLIAAGQKHIEDEAVGQLNKTGKNKFLFIDTTQHVIKIWSEFVFNACDNMILREVAAADYDLYLLMNTDLPWEADELREYPDLESRQKLFSHYLEEMKAQSKPFEIISGADDQRVTNALAAIQKRFIKSITDCTSE